MRVLVAYATRAGSTRGIAEAIGEAIRSRGVQVDVRDVSEPVDLAEYDAVIVGSAVRMRRWQREAMGFLLRNRQELQTKPIAYFSVSLAQAHESSAAQAEARRYREYPIQHFPEVTPVAAASFVGVLDLSALSASEAVYVRAFGVKEGDYRDWEVIRDWALQAVEAMGVLEPVLA